MTYTDDNDGAADTGAVTAAFTGMSATQTGVISGITSAGDANDTGVMTAAVSFALATDTLTDSGSITLGTTTTAATVAGANNAITFNVTANDYETLSLTNQGGTQTIATLTAGDATVLNINATKALNITTLTASAAAKIDASASTANVLVGATSIASTITGGAGNDNFTGSGSADSLVGGAGKDSLDGGAGNDTIYGGAGNDSLTGGSGNDFIYGEDGDDTFADATANTDRTDGGAGNDTFVTTLTLLTSGDTLIGGDGTDTIKITDTTDVNLTTDITKLLNVSGIEVIGFSGLNGSDTVTINDGVVSTAGGAITLAFLTGLTGANTVDASAVLSSNSTVTFTDLDGLATTYSVGNGKDILSLGDGNDSIVISNAAYLGSTDTLDGGSGSDTLTFTNDTAATNTITAAQLANVKGVETFTINHATDGNLVNYVFTLNDAFVGNQINVGGTFTINKDAAEDGTLKVIATDLTSNYNLSLTGADGVDTLTGGAGNDTLSGGVNDSDIDSITGGLGNDTFVVDSSKSAADVITDINFGTSTTSVDLISVTALVAASNLVWDGAGNAFSAGVIGKTSVLGETGTLADLTTVVMLDNATYGTLAAAETALEALAVGNVNQDVLFFWQDTLGNSHLSLGIEDNGAGDDGDDFTVTDLVKLTGVSISTIVTNFNISDIVAA